MRDDESIENVFYPTEDQKVPIKMMRARGYFKTGNLAKYESTVIELPYDVSIDKKHSLKHREILFILFTRTQIGMCIFPEHSILDGFDDAKRCRGIEKINQRI